MCWFYLLICFWLSFILITVDLIFFLPLLSVFKECIYVCLCVKPSLKWPLIHTCVFCNERDSFNWFWASLNFSSSHFWGSDGQPLPAGPQVSPHWHGATFTWARGLEIHKHLFTDVSLMPDYFHPVSVALGDFTEYIHKDGGRFLIDNSAVFILVTVPQHLFHVSNGTGWRMTNEFWHIHSVCQLHSRLKVERLYIHTVEQLQRFCGIWTHSLISFIALP